MSTEQHDAEQMLDMALELCRNLPEGDPDDYLYGNLELTAISLLEARATGQTERFIAGLALARAAPTGDGYVSVMIALCDVALAAMAGRFAEVGITPAEWLALARKTIIEEGTFP